LLCSWFCFLSSRAEPEKPNLTTGPNFGVHYYLTYLKTLPHHSAMLARATCIQ
jgi:hypothetical protein